MRARIDKLAPKHDEGLPFRAAIRTRDDRGQLVGIRVLRARTEAELERKLEPFRALTRTARLSEPSVGTEGNTPDPLESVTTTEGKS